MSALPLANAWDQHSFLSTMLQQAVNGSAFVIERHAIRRHLLTTAQQILSTPVSMRDLDNILDPSARVNEAGARRIPRVAQHVFQSRAVAVGQIVVNSAGYSPLVQQLKMCGLSLAHTECPRSGGRRTLDAMLFDERNQTRPQVVLVQGCTFSKAKRTDKRLRVAFGQPRLLEQLFVPSRSVRDLLYARDFLQPRFPDVNFQAVYMVVADPESLPHFVAIDVSSLKTNSVTNGKICLDPFPVATSSFGYAEEVQHEIGFDRLPRLAGPDWHDHAPLERCTRCAMLLTQFWHTQRPADELVLSAPSSIVRKAVERHKFEYMADLRRHDVEDVLERGNFVERAWQDGTKFGITTVGIGRIMLLHQKFNRMINIRAAEVIDAQEQQAEMWKRHYGLS